MTFSSDDISGFDKRTGRDRRSRPTRPIGKFWLIGRRKGPRRKGEKSGNFYVDRYSVRTLIIILMILLLSILDAAFTLYLVKNGAAELNPIMAHFLQYGPIAFMAAKYLLTISSILLLLINKNVFIFGSRFRAKYLFIPFLALFLAVVLWEIYLIL